MFLRRVVGFGLGLGLLLLIGTFAPPVQAGTAIGIVVNSLADTSGPCATSGTGTCTLRDALTISNAQKDSTQWNITFTVTGTIPLTSALPSIQNWLVIDGSSQQVTVSGEGAYRIFTIRRSGDLTLTALTLANGNGAADCGGSYNCGGAIKSRGVLVVKGSVLTGNNGDWYGGAIDNEGPALTIEDTIFSNNVTSAYYGLGSAIYNVSGEVVISNNTSFTGNTGFKGGAIYHNLGVLTIDGTTFSNNEADYGGALFSSAYATITNSTFSNNTLDNSATNTFGAAIYNGDSLRVTSVVFTNNSTCPLCFGGAIGNGGGTVRVKSSTFTGNYGQYGGAIYTQGGTVKLNTSTVADNKGWEGGGGLYNDSGTVNIVNSTFTQNHAPAGNGGALYNLDGAMTISSSTIWSNYAFPSAFDGGGIYNDGTSVTLLNTVVADNSNYQCYDYAKSLTADKYNMDDDGSCDDATQKKASDIALGTLGNNGGPTQTLKPGSTSVLINAGSNAVCPATDQRGVKRPQRVNCDVGAYEKR